MRDMNRIEPFMKEMGELWKENVPDWRFGQLMYNFFCQLGDPYNYEEDEFMEAFRAFLNHQDPKEAVQKLREEKIKEKKPIPDEWKKFFEQVEKMKNE